MRKTVLFLFTLLLVQQAISQAGSIDTSFGVGGRAVPLPGNRTEHLSITTFMPQPDGKIAVAGNYGNTGDYHIATGRYTLQGAADKIFSGDGVQEITGVATFFDPLIAVQRDGKTLVAAYNYIQNENPDEVAGHTDIALIRYNKNGTRDATFGANGAVSTNVGRTAADGSKTVSDDEPTSIAVAGSGNIFVTTTIYELHNGKMSPGIVLIIYNPDGSVNGIRRFYSNFVLGAESGTKVSTYKDGFVLSGAKADGSVFLYSSQFGEKTVMHSGDTNNFYEFGQTHRLLSNGKIVVVTNKIYDAYSLSYLDVLNVDGSPYTSFSDDGFLQFNSSIVALTSQSDAKIILSSDGAIMRYNTNGTLDYSFGTNGKVTSQSYRLETYGNRLYELGPYGLTAYILSTAPRYVKVNLVGNTDPYRNKEWNNWNNVKDLHFNSFYYSDSTASNISAVMSNRNGVNDNGAGYGSGMAPAGVLRHSSYSSSIRTITFSGLAVHKRYSFELYASRNTYSTDSTIFTINGVLKKIGTYRNFTNKATFTNLSPNAQGQLVITLRSAKTYNYLNGFVLTESFAAAANTQGLNSITATQHKETVVETGWLYVSAFPNPARQSFTVQLKGGNAPVQLQVFDATGRLVEARQNTAPNTALSIGQAYKPGVYYLEVVQGSQRKTVALLKAAQ